LTPARAGVMVSILFDERYAVYWKGDDPKLIA
jgi:hypothetical protein